LIQFLNALDVVAECPGRRVSALLCQYLRNIGKLIELCCTYTVFIIEDILPASIELTYCVPDLGAPECSRLDNEITQLNEILMVVTLAVICAPPILNSETAQHRDGIEVCHHDGSQVD
jgi:hypothetical protein